ncbi:YdcF family protein [Ectothiorhodospira sp. PHS-1]|uniref:YdcF family protein n=1 Tax=Ectothiorhodospira sp. PHS-1 TaxID=519989 RepID=UPI001FF066F3|nr:YdcF family protein [Ectothiorhodospira sp. PHS-1]
MWHGARLYHADRAPWVIVSGGSVPWRERERVEAHAMREFLVDLGVPASAVWLETDSATTRGNAVYTAQLLEDRGLERVLLVTSALHMERALATFRAAGVEAWPAPTDFEVEPLPADLLRWLPDAQALADSTRGLKEYLGLWVYRWRGWAE